jgi:hypothetical protein
MGMLGRGGLPHQGNLRRGQGVGLVDEVAERALQFQGFGGEDAGGRAERLVRSEKTCVSEGESPSSLEARLPEFGTKVMNGKV